jgi:hypothetical protein
VKLDLRPRCKRCKKLPRGKLAAANFERYKPFCSYGCQQWFNLENAQRYINSLLAEDTTGEGK